MPRPRKPRKLSAQGRATTLWLRRGTVTAAEREARKQGLSLSQFVERTVATALEAKPGAAEAVAA